MVNFLKYRILLRTHHITCIEIYRVLFICDQLTRICNVEGSFLQIVTCIRLVADYIHQLAPQALVDVIPTLLSPVRTQMLIPASLRAAIVAGTPSCSLSSIPVAPVANSQVVYVHMDTFIYSL